MKDPASQLKLPLSPRQADVLRAVVELFIETAEPVGSRTVSKAMNQQVSAATVRNVMADLEELGLLKQIHTSSGRVPTNRALRYWIEAMVRPVTPAPEVQEQLRLAVADVRAPRRALAALASELSRMTGSAGLARAPRLEQGRLQRASLVPVGGGRLMLLWVASNGVVYHREIQLAEEPAAEDVAHLEQVLNREFIGATFDEIRARLRQDLHEMKRRYDDLLEQLVVSAATADDDVIVEGVSRVVEQPDFNTLETLRRLYEAFEDRHLLAGVLDRVAASGGLRVLLNDEIGFADTQVGMVAAPFDADGVSRGSIGVFGPARMPYPEILGLVRFASMLVERVLADHHASEDREKQ